jgi:cytochrome c peroxidase
MASSKFLTFRPATLALLTTGATFAALLTTDFLTRARIDIEQVPLGLPPLPVLLGSPASVKLGQKLFFDRRLSINETMACGMCHIEAQAFTSNEVATSVGMEGKSLRRNAPSLFNVVYEKQLFRDGRESSLETQAWLPILTHDEMAAPSIGWALAKLKTMSEYKPLFAAAFPDRGISMETLAEAIASYERTLLSGNSRFDRWRYGGENEALSPLEKRGFELFKGKARCSACHVVESDSALFTDGKFHDVGIGYATTMGLEPRSFNVRLAADDYTLQQQRDVESITSPRANDLGRFEVTRDPKDRWAFKTPSLRDVAQTGPYMHDGSLRLLRKCWRILTEGETKAPTKASSSSRLGLARTRRKPSLPFSNL